MPAVVFQALFALGLLWGWADMAFLLGLGFLGMLRPGGIAKLVFGDLHFADICGSPALFVRISLPRMRRIGPRREHVRIDDAFFLSGLRRFAAGRGSSEPLFSGTQLEFASLFETMLVALSLP